MGVDVFAGIAEPMPVAETFTFGNTAGSKLAEVAKVDTMVTVVDAHTLAQQFRSLDTLATRNMAAFEDDERTVVDLVVDQIEFANGATDVGHLTLLST